MNKIFIRLAKKEDLKILSVLYTKIYKRVNIGEKWTIHSSDNLMQYWFKKQPDLFFVALIGDKIVGAFMAGIKPWWDGNHLMDGEIFVDYHFQKMGIGTGLSKVIYKKAKDKYRVKSIDFITYQGSNGFPLAWYQSLGFKVEKKLFMIHGEPNKALLKLREK